MKKFLLYISIMLAPLLAVAQQTRSLEIDQASLTPIHADALTGVAIDKIEPDYSQRPCARIKLHINRMSREDISGISVKVIGGNVVVMKRIVVAEGNGLIIELTAKPETRFYLHHDKYGDSNEISLNLEGNKEYRLNAQLNLLQSIVVSSNTTNADIYIDNVFKGSTGANFDLTIKEITHGSHKLRIEYGKSKSEKDIVVNSANIHFRLNIKHEQDHPQFVVFQITPNNASVIIDGKSYVPDAYGYVQTVLNNGTYTYSISTKDYHSETGSFIVNGAKIEKIVSLRPAYGWLQIVDTGALKGASIYIDGVLIGTAPIKSDKLTSGKHSVRIVKNLYKTFEGEVTISDGKTNEYAPNLTADFANVSLKVGDDCDIYINGTRKGKNFWHGELATGTYIFEARKDGHRSTSIARNIEASPSKQSFEIPTPTPILSAISIKSTPAMADVYIDNKLVGRTPLMHNIIIGKHYISIRKDGFESKEQYMTIEEGKTKEINYTLKDKKTIVSHSSNTKAQASSSSKFCFIKYAFSDASVYINGSYKGSANKSYLLTYGNNYIVVEHNGNHYGRIFNITKDSNAMLNMSGAAKVQSVYTLPKASKYKKHRSWDSFNLGAFTDLGCIFYDDTFFGIGTGLVCRLGYFDSLIVPTIAVRYMYGFGRTHTIGVPVVVNLNLTRWTDIAFYFGAGMEFLFTSRMTAFPIVLSVGVGGRHHDVNFYGNLGSSNSDSSSVGIRYTYFF